MSTLQAGRTVRGIIQGDSRPDQFIPDLVDLFVAGRFPIDRRVTFYDFALINQAAADTVSGATIKPVLRMRNDGGSSALPGEVALSSIENEQEGLQWQIGVWDRISPIYLREVDNRFTEVVDGVIRRAALQPGQRVLDLGTGTGSIAVRAASLVTPGGNVTAVDISPEMLGLARQRAAGLGLSNITFLEGRAEEIPARSDEYDVALASLSLMYVIDRSTAAREIGRVLRPGGRLVAAVWSGPEQADIVLFQQIAGGFASKPPVPGVGPGALADPGEFLVQLERAGIRASVKSETTGFAFDNFAAAWDTLAGVTTAQLPSDRQEEAKAAVRAKMWPMGEGPRQFRNLTHFITGAR